MVWLESISSSFSPGSFATALVGATALRVYDRRPRGFVNPSVRLLVAKSQVPGGGLGVFTEQALPAGTTLGAYPGRLLFMAENLSWLDSLLAAPLLGSLASWTGPVSFWLLYAFTNRARAAQISTRGRSATISASHRSKSFAPTPPCANAQVQPQARRAPARQLLLLEDARQPARARPDGPAGQHLRPRSPAARGWRARGGVAAWS